MIKGCETRPKACIQSATGAYPMMLKPLLNFTQFNFSLSFLGHYKHWMKSSQSQLMIPTFSLWFHACMYCFTSKSLWNPKILGCNLSVNKGTTTGTYSAIQLTGESVQGWLDRPECCFQDMCCCCVVNRTWWETGFSDPWEFSEILKKFPITQQDEKLKSRKCSQSRQTKPNFSSGPVTCLVLIILKPFNTNLTLFYFLFFFKPISWHKFSAHSKRKVVLNRTPVTFQFDNFEGGRLGNLETFFQHFFESGKAWKRALCHEQFQLWRIRFFQGKNVLLKNSQPALL